MSEKRSPLPAVINAQNPSFESIGRTDTICPYCQKTLDTKPSRKKKCSHCGSPIYVKTRPGDRVKVLATEEQAAHIERQWQIYHTIQSMSDEERVEYDKIRSSLVISSGSPPSHFDVKWTMCNKKLEENLRNGDWGLYRNARLEMAELLRGEDRIDEALRVFLEVMYLDINGPRNTGGVKDPAILREFPAFQPDLGLMAPAVVGSILELQEEIGFEKTDLSRRFEEEASRIRGQISLPITTDQAWQVFEDELLNWDQS